MNMEQDSFITLKRKLMKQGGSTMVEKTVHIPSISCGHCIMTIQREVGELDGVKAVEGDPMTKKVTVKWDNPATWEKIDNTLKEAGYPAR